MRWWCCNSCWCLFCYSQGELTVGRHSAQALGKCKRLALLNQCLRQAAVHRCTSVLLQLVLCMGFLCTGGSFLSFMDHPCCYSFGTKASRCAKTLLERTPLVSLACRVEVHCPKVFCRNEARVLCCSQHDTRERFMQAPIPLRAWVRRCFVFGLPALSVFCGLGALFYRLYGHAFFHEAFLYHASRQDPRHNFSPQFLFTYLYHFSPSSPEGGSLLPEVPMVLNPGVLAPVCMAVSILATSAAYADELDMCWLLSTLLFVAFNKVSTAQYFVWYLGILPVVLPEVLPGWGMRQSWAASSWLVAQLLWLAAAYRLEFLVWLQVTLSLSLRVHLQMPWLMGPALVPVGIARYMQHMTATYGCSI